MEIIRLKAHDDLYPDWNETDDDESIGMSFTDMNIEMEDLDQYEGGVT
jgi:hypothetical protein